MAKISYLFHSQDKKRLITVGPVTMPTGAKNFLKKIKIINKKGFKEYDMEESRISYRWKGGIVMVATSIQGAETRHKLFEFSIFKRKCAVSRMCVPHK